MLLALPPGPGPHPAELVGLVIGNGYCHTVVIEHCVLRAGLNVKGPGEDGKSVAAGIVNDSLPLILAASIRAAINA